MFLIIMYPFKDAWNIPYQTLIVSVFQYFVMQENFT